MKTKQIEISSLECVDRFLHFSIYMGRIFNYRKMKFHEMVLYRNYGHGPHDYTIHYSDEEILKLLGNKIKC